MCESSQPNPPLFKKACQWVTLTRRERIEVSALFLAQTLTYHRLSTSYLAAVFFIGKGKSLMTFLALISCDRRRQFEMKKIEVSWPILCPPPCFHLLCYSERKPNPQPPPVCLCFWGLPETRGAQSKDAKTSTFMSQATRHFFRWKDRNWVYRKKSHECSKSWDNSVVEF